MCENGLIFTWTEVLRKKKNQEKPHLKPNNKVSCVSKSSHWTNDQVLMWPVCDSLRCPHSWLQNGGRIQLITWVIVCRDCLHCLPGAMNCPVQLLKAYEFMYVFNMISKVQCEQKTKKKKSKSQRKKTFYVLLIG